MNYISNSQLDRVLSKLNCVKQTAPSQWEALCPAHDDRKPSLSISTGEDGRVLIHCQGGCKIEEVLEALELTEADLFPSAIGSSSKGDIVAEYNYHDADGKLLFQVVRLSPKDFRQRQPDGNGGWVWNIKGVEKVLHRLPELLAADPKEVVFIVEGEKDVDRLVTLGFVVTCNSGGAGKWRDEFSQSLEGRSIVILPDNDDAGRKHAQEVAASLTGVAASIKVVELPDLPEKGDVSDWLDAGGTKEMLLSIAGDAPEWFVARGHKRPEGLICLADVEPEEVQWLWPERIPMAKLTIFAGDPGLGKSFVSLSIAAAVSNGAPWPDDPDIQQVPGGVVILSAEDGLNDTIRPRLDSHGADCRQIEALTSFQNLSKDIDQLREAIQYVPKCRLVIIDPISAYLGETNSNNNAEVRGLLAPLAELAASTGVAVLAVTHLRKGEGPAIYRTMGSLGFVAAARVAWLICKDQNEPERRLLLCIKNNLAADSGNGLAYRIEDDVVCWEHDPVLITADEALAQEYGQKLSNDKADRKNSLIDFIAYKCGGSITTRKLQQKRKHRYPTAEEAECALNELVEAGEGYWEPIPPGERGGRASSVFVLHSISTSTQPSQTPAA